MAELFFKVKLWVPRQITLQHIGSIQVIEEPDRVWELPFNIKVHFHVEDIYIHHEE